MAQEHVFIVQHQTRANRLYYYISVSDVIIDSRDVITHTPAPSVLADVLSVVLTPGGETYTFVTSSELLTSLIASESEVYKSLVVGTMLRSDVVNLEVALHETLLQTNQYLTENYDDVTVQAVGQEDMINENRLEINIFLFSCFLHINFSQKMKSLNSKEFTILVN